PGGNPYTLRTFYEELSSNALHMQGKILGWVRLDSNETTYTGVPGTCSGNPYGTTNCNGLFSTDANFRMQAGFKQAVARVDNNVDFAQFDNDGPDGIPNSGDDDGYVDMIMFAHPTKDVACGGQPVRMEAWSLNELGWVSLQPLSTTGIYVLDPAATSRTGVYIRPPDPNLRGEYFLVENRQGGPAGLADSAMIRRHCQRSGQPSTCAGG